MSDGVLPRRDSEVLPYSSQTDQFIQIQPPPGGSVLSMDNLLLNDTREHCLDWNLGIFDDLEPEIHYFEDHSLFGGFAHEWEPNISSAPSQQETAATSHEASSDEGGESNGEEDAGEEYSDRVRLNLQRCRAVSTVAQRRQSLNSANSGQCDISECLHDGEVEETASGPLLGTSRSPREVRTRYGATRDSSRRVDENWAAARGSSNPLRASLTGRKKATEEAREVLMDWINANRDHPYPSREQKAELAQRTGLSVPQIVHWMSNVRKRRLIPLLRGRREPRSKIDRKFLEELQRRAL